MRGLPFPRTPSGRASLLPPLPWHYSGDLLTVEYRTDPSAIAALLPEGGDAPPRRRGPWCGGLHLGRLAELW